MSTLSLYAGISPNTNGKHVYYTALSNYTAYLSTYLLTSVTSDNYRINAGSIKIAPNTDITEANYKTVTYVYNDLDNTFYTVKRCELQCGYIIYEVEVDFWGTYIAVATYDSLNVLRCNRRLGVGLYDQIRATNTISTVNIPSPDYPTGYPLFYTLSNVYIVFALTYNVEQTVFGATSATGLYGINVKTLYDLYVAGGGDANENAIDIAVAVVGGIYGVEATNGYGHATTNDAKVTKAYIMDKTMISPYANNVVTITSKSMYGSWTAGHGIAVDFIDADVKTKSISIDNDPDYNFYLGTTNKGLKLIRTTETTLTGVYKCITSNNELCITVQQGDNQTDITSEYEVTLTLNDGDVTNLSAIKTALSMTLKTGQAVASKGVAGIATLAPEVINLMGQHYYGSQIGNGDGVINVRRAGIATLYLGAKYPYGYVKCKSVNDEQENAKKKGAFFDAYISSLDDVFTKSLLYGSDIPTYIQANASITNIPLVASNDIKGKLAGGVYVIKV